MNLTQPQQILLALLKLALWKTPPDKALFENAGDDIWKEVYRLSAEQGVKAIAYDGVTLLPLELQPAHSILFQWGIHVDGIERRFEKELQVANEMADIFAKNDIKMLLFKGLEMAQYYPSPEHREFGDIDFYLFGKKEEGEQLLLEAGATKNELQCDRHTKLLYKGILIENHEYILPEGELYNVPLLEERLMNALKNVNLSNNPLVKNALSPSLDFSILLMSSHTFWHFLGRNLLLRYLCDWALFLTANRGAIDFDSWRRVTIHSGFVKFADALSALAVKYLDLNPEFAPPFETNSAIEEKILQNMFNPLYFPINKNHSWTEKLRLKLKNFKYIRWKYDELFSTPQFYKIIRRSIMLYIRRPMRILKMS